MYMENFLPLSILCLVAIIIDNSQGVAVPGQKAPKTVINGHRWVPHPPLRQPPVPPPARKPHTKGIITNKHNTIYENTMTTESPELEGSTDIPEEREIGEDPTTSADGLTQRTESNYGTDPIEQRDPVVTKPMKHVRHSPPPAPKAPIVTPKPTRRPDPIVHARPTTTEAPVTEEVEYEEGSYPPGRHHGPPQTTPYYDPYDPYGYDHEQEDKLTSPRNTPPGGQQTDTCPAFTETTMGHHVIIRHNGCEIVLSQDDAIRWHGVPGSSPPIAYVRGFSSTV